MSCPTLYVWLNTCLQRRDHLGALRRSLLEAGIAPSERFHVLGLQYQEIKEWWKQQWLDAAVQARGSGCSHVLRIEDDIVVGRHLRHNVLTWPALGLDDFGVGLLFMDDSRLLNLGAWEIDPQTGALATKADYLPCGQGQLIETDFIDPVMRKFGDAESSFLHHYGMMHGSFFDCMFTHAASLLGRRLFVHVPAQVQTTELSTESALATGSSQSHSASKIWNPDWRRPEGRERDVEAEHLWGYETRWALLGDGGKGIVAQVRSAPNPSGPQLVNFAGRNVLVSPANLFPTREQAQARRDGR